MIDATELIALWKHRLAAISANANELFEAECTNRIRIRVREGFYQSMTRRCADKAITQISLLRDDYLLLANIVDEAIQAQQAGLFISRESRDEKVTELLCKASVIRNTGVVPLNQRTLLGSASQIERMTPEQLLELMQSEFQSARDLLNEIILAEAQNGLALDALRHDYGEMEQRAKRLKTDSEWLPFIEFQHLQSDPMSARAGIESLKRGLQSWSTNLDEFEKQKLSAEQILMQVKERFKQLKRLSDEYQSCLIPCKELLGDLLIQTMKQAPDNQNDILNNWCTTLETMLQDGKWKAVNVGAARLNEAMTEAIGNVTNALAETKLYISEADELEGQFTALKAKEIAILGLTRPEDGVAVLRIQIEKMLKARPMNLVEAREWLQKYQHILLAAGRC